MSNTARIDQWSLHHAVHELAYDTVPNDVSED